MIKQTRKLKICGMKFQENILEVAALQPDYLGFIFYDKSARFFDGEIPKLPKEIKKVGVFVNASLEYIRARIEKYDLQAVQLHGSESPEFCAVLQHQFSEIEIIKVFSIKEEFDFKVLQAFENVCDYFLFDTKGKLPGGNGYTFNWEVLKNYSSTKPYFLSGGIGFDAVEKIVNFLKEDASKYCYVIDVNSKFELEPGLKNSKTLKAFKNTLKL